LKINIEEKECESIINFANDFRGIGRFRILVALGITKACIVVQEVGKTGSPPPNYIFELVLLFLGLAILTCGYLQKRKLVKDAGIQIVNGLVISLISGILTFRTATIGHGEVSVIYYLAYILLVLGLVVFVVGIRQLTHAADLRK